jgi:hypothetical protein
MFARGQIIFLMAIALAGCTLLRRPPEVPETFRRDVDQLVVLSNFSLPQQHRLFEDLRTQRGLIASTLNLNLSTEPVYVYLFSSANDFKLHALAHFPQIADRRAFFVESDTRLAVYAYWGDRVAEDLRHEVAHGYLHSTVRNLPLWLDEGLAEFFEVPVGHGGFNRPHVELLTKMRSEGWQPSLRTLEQLTDGSTMSQLEYAESWAWVHWLMQTTPERRAFLQSYLARLKEAGTIEPMSVSIRQLHLDYERQLVDHIASLATALR